MSRRKRTSSAAASKAADAMPPSVTTSGDQALCPSAVPVHVYLHHASNLSRRHTSVTTSGESLTPDRRNSLALHAEYSRLEYITFSQLFQEDICSAKS